MASLPDSRPFQPVVNYDEPPVKPPPISEVGVLGWLRKNLFSSVFDTIVTLISAVIVVGGLTGFIGWAVQQANWFAITFNFRLYMVGRYPQEDEWRVQIVLLVMAFTVGMAFAAFSRLRRSLLIALVVIVALLFLLPIVIRAIAPLPYNYFTAANIDIPLSGTDVLAPNRQLAFIGRAGESITIQVSPTTTDAAVAGLNGFVDDYTNQLRNIAEDRFENQTRLDEINGALASDLLTPGQRSRLTIQQERITVPDSVAETFALNQGAVQLRILDGANLDTVVAEGLLDTSSSALTFTLPADGWYVLEKEVQSETNSAVMLQTTGIYPLLERTVSAEGEGATGSVSEYARMTDGFTIGTARPETPEGRNIPMNTIIDNAYRGSRSFTEYLSLFVGPFFAQISVGALAVVALFILAYFIGRILDQRLSPVEDFSRTSRRLAVWLLAASPVLMFLFIYGLGNLLPLTNPARWGGLMLTGLLTISGIILSFPLGILLALGRRSHYPAISAICTGYIELVRGVPLISILFMAFLLVPLVNPDLKETPGVFRAIIGIVLFEAAYLAENIRGGLQTIPPGQIEAAKALGLNGVQITLQITLPQALRTVIPALVGQFIALFMDTTLVTIVGLLDLTGIGRNVVNQTEFLGLRPEIFTFLLILYFIGSYTMSLISRRIEATGSGKALARRI